MRNDYECIAYSIKMLCYEEKYEEAKKIYENCVKQGKLPQLYFDKERYAGEVCLNGCVLHGMKK